MTILTKSKKEFITSGLAVVFVAAKFWGNDDEKLQDVLTTAMAMISGALNIDPAVVEQEAIRICRDARKAAEEKGEDDDGK